MNGSRRIMLDPETDILVFHRNHKRGKYRKKKGGKHPRRFSNPSANKRQRFRGVFNQRFLHLRHPLIRGPGTGGCVGAHPGKTLGKNR